MRLALAALATAALIGSAAGYSTHRLVLVVGAPGDKNVTAQLALLAQAKAALAERDVIIQTLPLEGARAALGAGAPFTLLLVGKDGGVKLRRHAVTSPAEIAALIDTMPMRQEEMRR